MADQRLNYLGILLGSGLLAAAVSGAVSLYLNRTTSLTFEIEQERLFVELVSSLSERHKSNSDLSFVWVVQNVLYPIYDDGDSSSETKFEKVLTSLVAQSSGNDLLDSPKTERGSESSQDVGKTNSPRSLIEQLQNAGELTQGTSSTDIREAFWGEFRLQYSDFLVSVYEDGNAEIVNELLKAIYLDASEKEAYRVNLYVCFTLSKLSNWSGNQELLSRFNQVTVEGEGNMRDDTYKLRCDAAKRSQNS